MNYGSNQTKQETSILASLYLPVLTARGLHQMHCEQVVPISVDGELIGFIAIHNTKRGPAIGGLRIWRYPNHRDLLKDALSLARAMTYKTALAGLNCGGGKAVIMLPEADNRRRALHQVGKTIQALKGRFLLGPDVGVKREDMSELVRATEYINDENTCSVDDLSAHTALGVWHAMKACIEHHRIVNAHVAIQGLGNVGMRLAKLVHENGLKLSVSDISPIRVQEAERDFGALRIPEEEILSTECDLLAPCAMGGVIGRPNIEQLRTRIICGSANNILSSTGTAELLFERGITFAPDIIASAGGVIRGAEAFQGIADSTLSVSKIYDRMLDLLRRAQSHGVPLTKLCMQDARAVLRSSKAGAFT